MGLLEKVNEIMDGQFSLFVGFYLCKFNLLTQMLFVNLKSIFAVYSRSFLDMHKDAEILSQLICTFPAEVK